MASAQFNITGTKKVQKMFKTAVKKSKRSAECAFTETVLFAHQTASERARSRKIRPYWRTGNYTRSINFKIKKSGGFTGTIFSPVGYAKKLEGWYENLKISAEIALRDFDKFMKRCYKEEMRKRK